jgi:response regulator of citrate/malate metabolism
MSNDELEKIRDTIEEIRSLMVLVNQDKLASIKENLLTPGSIKEKVYDMCDETKTAEEIAQAIGKGAAYVRSYLSILRREGFIRNVVKDGKTVYRQVF